MRLRREREKMPDKFVPLAYYNSEVSRGVVHTEEYATQMAALQSEFDEWMRASLGVKR